MSKQRLRHQPRPVLYDSGVVSRLLDDAVGLKSAGFVSAHLSVLANQQVYISQTVLFEMQPVVRVLANRYPNRVAKVKQGLIDFEVLALSEQIGKVAISLKGGIEQLKFADATIAATAIVHQLDLFTLNEADFAVIPGLRLYKPDNYAELLARISTAKG